MGSEWFLGGSVPSTTTRRRSGGRRAGAGLFPQTMSVLGNRWGFALLVAAFVGISRFTDFQTELGAPPATIADRLAIFTAEGILQQPTRATGSPRRDVRCFRSWCARWHGHSAGSPTRTGPR